MKNRKYMKSVLLLGVFLSLGLTSCQVVNKYKTPDIDDAYLYRGESSVDTTTIATIPWREYFTDPYLQSLIEEGLQQNFNLQIAYTRIRQAEVALGIARAAYFPTAALSGQVQHRRTSVDASGNKDVLGVTSNQYNLGIAVQWEADIWGKINRQQRAKYAQFLNSYAYRNLIQTSLIANIATSYYSLTALDEQLNITKEMVVILGESVETMQAMMDAGLLNGASVEQSKSLLYSTQVSIPGLESQIRQLENSLSVMLGRNPGSISRATLATQSVPKEMKQGIPAQMLAKRPDVMQAELNFRSAFELTNAAQAALYPSITLSTGSMIGYGANTLSSFFRPENLLLNVIGGLTQPLFAGKQLIGQVQIAKAQQEEALLNFRQTVLSAGQEVSDILFTFESSLRKNESRNKQVEAAKTALYYTQELLKAGEANYTEVLTAEQNLLQAQLGQVSDKLEQLQATVNLYRALGGGVE
ncbi:multidrug efflux system outer membrane protein [Parabacteroides sp. PF5-5]|uniref:efflux transporter outer membrane subunit n=1 Tax=unclassified Parabacteroides TaxID=2649774 RepID=UPI002476FC38|nr:MULTISPECIES: efflux transporter outer membrane subunit [unclassified Parabacteroides]MDH6304995.1 multidrug efflux system outer membrane protein [Parabacteroides sp. PH5-39]MDH6315920.1 multidrug efflux system outer membrane protein [Parabacteroides sp. PF5-13]MDH6319577.1 multidrug efflux system outer membrane protein [Parabacteroides sp. PH5-13]MDH6323308.1 multidrug efflux system outer membrane protein [Parabacteroides sp. PH5-8]MDH6327184.1 multidrug efflux system outer membrane protei